MAALIEAPLLASVAQDRRSIAEASAAVQSTGADSLAALRAEQAKVAAFVASGSWDLRGTSPELMSAELQRSMQQFAGDSGATLASSRTVPVQLGDGLAKIGLEIELDATTPSLQALLYRIEAARPRIFVDELTVQTPENASKADGQSSLAVALHISIYGRPAAGNAS